MRCWQFTLVREFVVRRGDWGAVADDEGAQEPEEEVLEVHGAGHVSAVQVMLDVRDLHCFVLM